MPELSIVDSQPLPAASPPLRDSQGATTVAPPVQSTLDLISHYESGGRNVPNYRFDPGHTAQGYYQITNSNWNQIAPRVGIDTATYPNAMSAPKDVQAKVAGYLLTQTPGGIRNWSDFNPQLRAALSAAPVRVASTGTASRSAGADTGAPPAPAQPLSIADNAGPTGGDDIMSRIMRGEQVQVTPSDILRIAFGPTGAEQAPTLSVAKSEPLSILKSEPLPAPPPPTPQQPPALERLWNAFTSSSGLQTLGGLSSAFPALAGRLEGMPDYANEQRFKNAVTGLYQGVVNEPWRIGAELQKYSQAMLRGDVNEAADHLWFTIPFLGAAGAQMKEYLERGDYAGAAGHAAGVLSSAAVATPEGRAAVAEAPAAVAEAVPAAATAVKEAAGDAATFAKGAVPAAAKAAGKRPPVGAALLGQMVGGPKGAAVAATIAKAPSVIRAAIRGGRAALDAASEAEAAAAAPEAAAAAATPGQAYAAAQGVDWGSLSATDRQAMEQIAQAHANVAQAAQSPRVMPSTEAAQVFPHVDLEEPGAAPATEPAPAPRAAPVAVEPSAPSSEIPTTSAAPTFMQSVLDRARGFLSRVPGVSLGDLQGILDRVRSRLSAQPDLEETVTPRPAGRPPGPPGPPGPVMSRAERRATVMPPEEGIPEQVARAQAEREAIIGKPRDEWTNADVLAADALRAEGYTGGAQPISRPPAARPSPVPPAAPAPEPAGGTGLGQLGEMGQAITGNMYQMLWDKVLKGDVTEAGAPSAVLQVAKAVRSRGGLQTIDDLRALSNDFANIPRGPQFQNDMRALVDKYSPPGSGFSLPVAPEPAAPPASASSAAQALYDELKRSGTLEPEPAPAEKPAFEQRARDAKVDKLYDLIVGKQVPQSWVQRFTPESWRILAHEVGVPEPSAATIKQLKARLADYYRPQTLPATTPAEAQAAFDAARARVQ